MNNQFSLRPLTEDDAESLALHLNNKKVWDNLRDALPYPYTPQDAASNALEYIKAFAGANYTGQSHYIDEPAVRDGNIVTANGFSALEFCHEILYTLEAYPPKMIEKSHRMNETGVWEAPEVE